MDKKISMADIASLAGVSVATVSRILNNNGRYSPETEKRVMDLVNSYGYKVNQNAKGLRTNKTQSIGIIVPDITNEFFAKIIRSVEYHIAPYGYTVFVCDSDENQKMEAFHIKSLAAKDVDGIIYVAVTTDVQSIHEKYSVPVIYIDRRPENAGTLVTSDNEFGGYCAAEKLIKAGCKKILMLRDNRKTSPVQARFIGYTDAYRKYGLALDTSLLVDVKVDYSEAKKTVKALLDKGVEFDGIFASSDTIALGALHAVKQFGKKVPEEIKLVGFDGVTITEVCDPPLTSVVQNTDMLGKIAVDALLARIENDEMRDETFIVPVSLAQRRSTESC